MCGPRLPAWILPNVSLDLTVGGECSVMLEDKALATDVTLLPGNLGAKLRSSARCLTRAGAL